MGFEGVAWDIAAAIEGKSNKEGDERMRHNERMLSEYVSDHDCRTSPPMQLQPEVNVDVAQHAQSIKRSKFSNLIWDGLCLILILRIET